LAQRRAWEKTLGFQDRDRFRAGIEGRISAVDARTGVKQLRMRGSDAVRFCAILKATSVNIFRVAFVRRALLQRSDTLGAEKPGLYRGILFFKELGGVLRG
jgi:hypothetical protein